MRISDWSSDVCSSDLRNRCPCPRHLGELAVEAQENVAITSLGEMQRVGKIHAVAQPFDCSRKQAGFLDGYARQARQPAKPVGDLRWREAIDAAQPPPSSEERRVGTESVSTGRSRWCTSQ